MRRILALTLLPLLASACSSSDAPPAPPVDQGPVKELSYEVFPFVLQLDEAALGSLTASEEDGTLRFDSSPAALAEVKRGSILLAGASDKAPYGLLRIVREVAQDGSGLVLQTVGAPPQLAFRNLHVRASASLASITDPATDWQTHPLDPMIHGSGKGAEPIDFYLFDGDGDTSTKDDQVHVHGELGGGIDYDVGIDTDWGALDALKAVEECTEQILTFGLSGDCELPELEAYFYVTPTATAKVMFEGAAFKGYEKDYNLASVKLVPGVIPIGPLLFTITVDVVAHIEGAASSRFSVGASASVATTTGLEFGSFSGVSFTPPVPEFTFTPESTEVTLSGRAKVSIGPRLSFRLYDVAGPFAGLYATASLDAEQSRTPCYDLHAGAETEVGFLLTLPGLGNLIDEGKTFPLIDESIATGSCAQPPGSSTKPPGGGPDADHLLNPTFTPWASMYDSPVKWFPHQSEDLAWTDVSRAIDGHWLVAGSGLDALTKVSDDGQVVWSKRFLDPRTEAPYGPEPQPYLMQRALPTSDAALLVVGYPYSLFKIGQAGGVHWAERFEPAEQLTETGPNGWLSDQRTFLNAVPDGQGGFFVAGSYEETDATPSSMWLMRVAADGALVWSRQYDNGTFLYPTNLVALGGGVVVAGLDWDKASSTRRMWLARVDTDGSVAWAKRFVGCTGIGYPGMQPFDAQRLANDDILVAGALDLGRRSFVLEVTPEGEVRWASLQWGDDTLTDMAIHSVRELPTTGFVAAGRYHYHFEQERLFLAGLDAKGRTQWIKIYGQPSTEAGIPAEQKFPGIQLTDEGGVMLAAYTNAPVPSENDNLWMLQAPAKDGVIAFQPGEAELLEYPHATVDCPLAEEAVILTARDLNLAAESFVPLAEPVQLQVTSQTP